MYLSPAVRVVRTACAGLMVGALYGAALRAWMRLISTSPEFSWSGTGYIVGVFAVLGAMAGLATAGAREGWGRRLLAVRSAGIVLSLGCFVAAGSFMLPTVVPAALGRARSDWPRPLRVALVALGAAVAVALSVFATLSGLPPWRLILGLVLYLMLSWVEVELLARLLAPSLPAGTLGRGRRVAAVAAAATLALGLVVLTRGLPGTG